MIYGWKFKSEAVLRYFVSTTSVSDASWSQILHNQQKENIGEISAFLFPYIASSLLFGFPMLFTEFSIGQFTQRGPSLAFRKIVPRFQGIGWTMAFISYFTSLYSNGIVAWTIIYMYYVITGNGSQISICENEWNIKAGQQCISSANDELCNVESEGNLTFYFNGTCYAEEMRDKAANMSSVMIMSATEQFFENLVLMRSSGINELGGINWTMVLTLLIAWVLTAFCLLFGVKWTGRISYFSATVPFLIIIVLLCRAVTLPGADVGIQYYLTDPQWHLLLKFDTWKNAVIQNCYSFGLGFGSLLSLASYNKKTHRALKDAVIVCFCDTFMSVIGGTAIFSVLGFMAKQQNKHLSEVVQEGSGLVFIAYPEAMSQMPLADLWMFIFFTMLFIIGFSSQFGMCECCVTSVLDQFPSLKRVHVVLGVCLSLFLLGLIMCTGSGIYWFTMFNNYAASFGFVFGIMAELFVIVYIYGIKRWRSNLREMYGAPKTCFSNFFGSTGLFFMFDLVVLAPIIICTVSFVVIKSMFIDEDTYGVGAFRHVFPSWTKVVGIAIGVIPALAVPLFFFLNWNVSVSLSSKEKEDENPEKSEESEENDFSGTTSTTVLVDCPYPFEAIEEIEKNSRKEESEKQSTPKPENVEKIE